MLPTREEAEALLAEGAKRNPGPWENHSRITALCAQQLAAACPDMNAEKAYITGLLHDIGRRFGARHLGHVYDGWKYMLQLGFDEPARICLTHSFCEGTLDNYIGNFDISEAETQELQQALAQITFDDYDKLIQLCDSISGGEGIMSIEDRMNDVKRRYGSYPESKWNTNLAIKKYFEEKAGGDIYRIVNAPL